MYHWIGGRLYLHHIGGDISVALRYPIEAMSGSGPLWFIQLLWVFSLLLLLVRKLDKDERFYNLCGKATLPVLPALFLPVWGAALAASAALADDVRRAAAHPRSAPAAVRHFAKMANFLC